MESFYTVIRNDTLCGGAQGFYGHGMRSPMTAQANGIADPDRIFLGHVVRIRDLTPPHPGPPPVAQPAREPVDFRLLRPADLLNLHKASGCRVVTGGEGATEPLAKYTVRSGDNLWNLAVHYYGDGRPYRLIAQANHIPNPSVISAWSGPHHSASPGPTTTEEAEQLLTRGSVDLRLQIEEHEKLPVDDKTGEQTLSTTERLVYADQFRL